METADTLSFALNDRIQDREIGPQYVPLALLGQFETDVEEFLRGSQRDVDLSQVIVSIESGSLTIVATGLRAAGSLWTDIARLVDPAALGVIDPKRAAVVERWQAAARKHPSRRYRLTDMRGRFSIEVDTDSDFRDRTEVSWVPVEKHLFGTIIDWGGKTNPNVHLDVGYGRTLKIASSQRLLAEEPENRLYKPALLHVAAEENFKTGELRNMTLLAFEERMPTWDETGFDELVRKGTRAWAQVSDDWLEELRGGGE